MVETLTIRTSQTSKEHSASNTLSWRFRRLDRKQIHCILLFFTVAMSHLTNSVNFAWCDLQVIQ